MGEVAALQGVWNIVPTPFLPDGELDEASIPTLVRFVRDTGVAGMTILGVLGEAAKLADAERTIVIERAIDAAGGSIPICVGVSHASTHRAIAFAREAEAAGAHSVMLAPPALARPTDSAIRRHYFAVAEAIAIPIVVQDHPASSGVPMSAELVVEMFREAPTLACVKLEEEPTPPKAGRLVELAPDLRVLGGLGGEMLLEELRRGTHGTMTGFGYPEVLVAVVRRFAAGDRTGAAAVFDRFATLVRFENQALINLPIRKLVYQRRGAIAHAHLRAPGGTVDEGTRTDLSDLLERTGLAAHAAAGSVLPELLAG